ncbi:hypothetical protein [Rheinheimera tilapiae]|uniref:Uncharacterized protein n=1 Tax=Rheinheimera tilapiae TaxID=875043 RepID=A0ABV6B7F1_9GAMM
MANNFQSARSYGQLASVVGFALKFLSFKTKTTKKTNPPLKRADANQRFEVLSWGVFECGDGSAARVAPAPQIVDFHRSFERNRGRFFFGYFLLLKQKKVTHRQVKSLLDGLTVKVKTKNKPSAARRAKASASIQPIGPNTR